MVFDIIGKANFVIVFIAQISYSVEIDRFVRQEFSIKWVIFSETFMGNYGKI